MGTKLLIKIKMCTRIPKLDIVLGLFSFPSGLGATILIYSHIIFDDLKI